MTSVGSRTGVAWALASALSYSTSSIFGKQLLKPLGVVSLTFWRFVVSTLVLVVVVAVHRRYVERRDGASVAGSGSDVPVGRLLILGASFGGLVLVGFTALRYIDASIYVVLVYLYPTFVVIGSAALGRPVHRIAWVALGMVTLGVVLTVPDVFRGVGETSALGVALTIAQALMFAAYLLVSERWIPPHTNGLEQAFWTSVGALAAVTPVGLIAGLIVPRGGRVLTLVLFFALITSVTGTVCMFNALRVAHPGVVATVLTLEVAFAICWAAVFLDEQVKALAVVGAAVVIAGVLLAGRVNMSPPTAKAEVSRT